MIKQSNNNFTRPGYLHLFVFSFLLLAASCKNKTQEINELLSKNSLHEDRAEEVTIIFSTQGKVSVRLFAKEFIRNESAKPPYTDMQQGLYVEFFDDSLRATSTLSAKYARYYETKGYVLIRDSVVVKNKKGEKLSTEELVWNQSLQKFYTEKFVKIETPTQTIFGTGLEANQDFSWYQINNIRGNLQVEKDKMPAQ